MARQDETGDNFFYGTAVALNGRGILLFGPSGSGKSALALDLVARGAKLVGDDRVHLSLEEGALTARPRPGFEGQIECRGVGLLSVPAEASARIDFAIDMGREAHDRLPPSRDIYLLGCKIPLLHRANGPHFPAAIFLMLTGARRSDDG